ncbi:hypothetical protein MPSI1_001280 [Malassezia psittaci]|uniref:alpha,alpha-trehalose-phosphate synthase (UDP-forming) n=1 Tax=Malassezia psittaci TaxID=1821823 RepID=A0AAF0F9X9_9BASI|nr:hypothetical protein MPSI1_001280 [Malassezia psittaci]
MPEPSERLVVVSNRLPVTITADPSVPGGYVFSKSSGGLVSALRGIKTCMNFTWIGWPGISVPPSSIPYIETTLREEYHCTPVWLPDVLAERHYNGFSNSILWPLFHYHPGEMNFDEANWIAYREANKHFAHTVQQILRPGDRVWVQDYHLMLLPLMLTGLLEGCDLNVMVPGDCSKLGMTPELLTDIVTESPKLIESSGLERSKSDLRRKDIHLGFFLHTPFPSSEVYRILGVPTFPNGADFCGRRVQVRTYPIGIEPQQFEDALLSEPVQNRIAALKRRFDGVKIIVGVDRLDYIKGLPQKLQGLEAFFENHPEWIGRTVLVQIAVPSRQDVEEYQNLRSTVNEMVGRINGRFGTVESLPIHLLYRSVNFEELCALYAVSDVCLVTSTRDGMNLVSYEYVACQRGRNGVMILSEFAGAAQSLNGALIVNPWDRFAIANAIHSAMTMSLETRQSNAEKLLRYIQRHTASWWGHSFAEDLGKARSDKLGTSIEHA